MWSDQTGCCQKNIKTGWEMIRQHPTLEVIDGSGFWSDQSAATFWKRFDAGEFTNAVRPVLPARPAPPK